MSVRVAIAIAALSLVTGVVLAGQFANRERGAATPQVSPSAATNSVKDGVGPKDVTDGIPSGFARSREGAVAAAAAFVATGQALLDLDPLAADRALREMAATESADRFVTETTTQLSAAREALAGGRGPIIYRQAIVAHRVEAFDPARARIAIWNVGVLTRDGVAPPQAAWAISTLDLVWQRDDWRIWSETIVPGPAPILNDSTAPATAQELTTALDGFTDFARPA